MIQIQIILCISSYTIMQQYSEGGVTRMHWMTTGEQLKADLVEMLPIEMVDMEPAESSYGVIGTARLGIILVIMCGSFNTQVRRNYSFVCSLFR
jgi:hypothetical protein